MLGQPCILGDFSEPSPSESPHFLNEGDQGKAWNTGGEQTSVSELALPATSSVMLSKSLRSQSFSLLTRCDNVICQLDWAVEWPLVKNCPGCF